MPPSEPTVSDGKRVSKPISSARYWSIVTFPPGRFWASEIPEGVIRRLDEAQEQDSDPGPEQGGEPADGVTRRDFLRAGTLGAIGLSLPQFNALRAMGAVGKGNAVPGTFAANCLLARRLLERGVRFVQLYSGGSFGISTQVPCTSNFQP